MTESALFIYHSNQRIPPLTMGFKPTLLCWPRSSPSRVLSFLRSVVLLSLASLSALCCLLPGRPLGTHFVFPILLARAQLPQAHSLFSHGYLSSTVAIPVIHKPLPSLFVLRINLSSTTPPPTTGISECWVLCFPLPKFLRSHLLTNYV
jgi:hypothetical protein